MLAVVKQKSTFLAPVGIGLVLFVNQLVGKYTQSMSTSTYYNGCALNPARALGPDVINRSFPGYHWIYWVGPLLGSLLACGSYGFISIFHYEAVNPGQDFNQWEASAGPGSWNDDMDRPSHDLSDTDGLNARLAPGGQPNHHTTHEANINGDSGPVDKEYSEQQV
ncbi:hypothetical protein SI65_04038 [Aspergillus cristatus]|uniref:Aquaporin n=1 Tax=Aspergillus cristatus TaxID=573508 RepID=A0A1E3BJ42_ASPCR|nr:hypothetical protein SI65_04038 [Aspergillus cristatus]